MIKNAKAGKKLPVYGDGINIRDWIPVSDHCSSIRFFVTAQTDIVGLRLQF